MSAATPAAAALDLHRRHARRALWALLALAAAIGTSSAIADARETVEPPLWTLAYNLGFGALTFAWVHFDGRRRGYRPSLLLKLGVVLLAIVALPWYLLRSRRGGERWLALARLAGFFALLVLAASAGYTLGQALT
jgi:Flp pilus assembly protein TadB